VIYSVLNNIIIYINIIFRVQIKKKNVVIQNLKKLTRMVLRLKLSFKHVVLLSCLYFLWLIRFCIITHVLCVLVGF